MYRESRLRRMKEQGELAAYLGLAIPRRGEEGNILYARTLAPTEEESNRIEGWISGPSFLNMGGWNRRNSSSPADGSKRCRKR